VISRNPKGDGVIHTFVRDLIEKKKAEEDQRKLREQFQEAQKMEAVGRLAGGTAHDFNNLLAVINGYCEMGLELATDNELLCTDLREIKRAARRAATLTGQLLAFSRRQILQPRVVDLGALVEGMIDMIERLLGEHIRVRKLRQSELCGIRADPERIEQVLMNLAVNSRDAMPQGGVLSMGTSDLSLSKEVPGETSRSTARRLRTSFCDRHRSGHGSGHSGARFRAFLYDQGKRQRHRVGSCKGLRHRHAE
jgi:signal transduction histidine kinase